jgi:ribonuclease HI
MQNKPSTEAEVIDAEVYCDGASSGNPGHAGIGVVIRLANRTHREYRFSEYIGVATNNVAEYSALLTGLKEAKSLGLKRIGVFLDSELLVKQLNGDYKVKNIKLRQLWTEARDILKHFEHYTFRHIRRELNKEADLLAKKSIRGKSGI